MHLLPLNDAPRAGQTPRWPVVIGFLGFALLMAPRNVRAETIAPALPGPDEARESTSVEEPNAEARRLSDAGMALFRSGDYEQAIQQFGAAYQLSGAPLLLYDIAQAERLRGNCASAVAWYRKFLDTRPEGRARELSEQRIAELASCAESAQAVEKASASARVAPKPVREDAEAEAAVAAKARRMQKSAARTPFRPARSQSRRTWAVVSYGSAAALLGISGYFGWRAKQAADQTSEVFSNRRAWNDEYAEQERIGMRDAKLSVGSLIGALAAGGIATWLWTFD